MWTAGQHGLCNFGNSNIIHLQVKRPEGFFERHCAAIQTFGTVYIQ